MAMRKFLCGLTILLAFFDFKSQTILCNRWDLGINLGTMISGRNESIRSNYLVSNYELHGRYMFNHFKGIRGNIGYQELLYSNSSSATRGIRFSIGPALNLIKIEQQKRFGLVGFAGAGYAANWNWEIYNQAALIGAIRTGSVDEVLHFLIGINPKIKITENVVFNAELQLMTNFFQQQGSDFYDNDNIPYNNPNIGTYASLTGGFSISFGKHRKHIDWSNDCFIQTKPNPVSQNSTDTVEYMVITNDGSMLKGTLGKVDESNVCVNDATLGLTCIPKYKVTQIVRLQDDDQDGIINTFDQEPNSPAGGVVDANGKTVAFANDRDMDGVLDSLDACPELFGTTNGCPAMDSAQLAAKNIELLQLGINDILFAKGSPWLNPIYYPILNNLVAFMQKNDKIVILVTGYTDLSGPNEVNNNLSKARAHVVADYLTKQGIHANQFEIMFKGSSQVKYSGRTEETDAANRRVSFSIKP
jgi:outer membrane protein OmpA-like peptidoglycan-associated protein